MVEREPETIEVDPEEFDPEELERAARALRRGELVAFPTETVYGLGADATDEEAVRGIFRAKGRPAGHPLIVHVASARQAEQFAADWPEEARRLAAQFWPGPLTLVVEKVDAIPDVVTGGLSTVGLRSPAHPVARALLEEVGVPVAAPSANPHTRLSPTRARHVLEGLGVAVDVVVDGGPTEVGIESTVLSLVRSSPTILRPGMVGRAELEEVVGPVHVAEDVVESDRPRSSPGRAASHYAPRARLRVRSPQEISADWPDAEERTGLVAIGSAEVQPGGRRDRIFELPGRPDPFARELYDVLHRLDRLGCTEIWVEVPPEGPGWRAVRDRLRRAEGE